MELVAERLWDGSAASLGERVVGRLSPEEGGLRLEIDAPFHDDPAPVGPPGPTARLWEHEVVELFVGGADGSYLEVELSPHGHHLVLILSGIRQVREELLPLQREVSLEGGRWTVAASLPAAWLPPRPRRVNLCAIHGQGAQRRYLSMARLPGPRPDFHQPEAWVQLRSATRA